MHGVPLPRLHPTKADADERAVDDLRRAQALCEVAYRVYNKERVLCLIVCACDGEGDVLARDEADGLLGVAGGDEHGVGGDVAPARLLAAALGVVVGLAHA